MPDNTPTGWPPAPAQTGAPAQAKKAGNPAASRISLVLSILAVLALGLTYQSNFIGGSWLFMGLLYFSTRLLLLTLWITALVFGLFGRRSRSGKAGLLICLGIVVVIGAGWAWNAWLAS